MFQHLSLFEQVPQLQGVPGKQGFVQLKIPDQVANAARIRTYLHESNVPWRHLAMCLPPPASPHKTSFTSYNITHISLHVLFVLKPPLKLLPRLVDF